MYAVANGDHTKVKIEIANRSPLLRISLNGLSGGDVVNYIEAFTDYLSVLSESLEKIPRVLAEMVELVDKA